MGQLALGFRSLLIKISIFFVMAGLLAWALGGTLFPQPTIVNLPGAGEVYWRVSSGGKINGLLWTLMRDDEEIRSGHWQSVVGPVIVDGDAWIATGNSGQWSFSKVIGSNVENIATPPAEVLDSLFPSSEK
jgi:hypothetical protein